MPYAIYHFPPNFRWGVATASHQVEGDNKRNQWWNWEQQPGRIAEGHRSGLACNWWQNAEADFDYAMSMGLTSLRLSIEWSRVEVAPGEIDTTALDRYREMLQALKDRGITPMVTLHHFSDPLWLAQKGGWSNPAVISYFSHYVEQVVQALGEFATCWCTLNEPNVYASLGYIRGVFPPGEQNIKKAALVLRHMLQAHAAAYKLIHRLQAAASVGLAHNIRFFDPVNPRSPRDRMVARIQDLWFNRTTTAAIWNGIWLPPVGYGPAFGMRHTLDWIGLNYYTRDLIAYDKNAGPGYGRVERTPDAELMDGGYGEFYPEGLARALRRLARLGIPIHITENGIPDTDDDQRPRALLLHLYHLWRALQGNIPVQSYHHWTLVDNFEWAEGWTLPFGLIEMDLRTQKRKSRPSADLYAAIARGNAITPELIDAYAPELRPLLLPV